MRVVSSKALALTGVLYLQKLNNQVGDYHRQQKGVQDKLQAPLLLVLDLFFGEFIESLP